MEHTNDEPFGPEWIAEMKKMPKDNILEVAARIGKQRNELRETVKELRSVTEAFLSLYDKYANDNPSEDHLADYAKDVLTRSKHLS